MNFRRIGCCELSQIGFGKAVCVYIDVVHEDVPSITASLAAEKIFLDLGGAKQAVGGVILVRAIGAPKSAMTPPPVYWLIVPSNR